MSMPSKQSELVDPRWSELINQSWTCVSCGEKHQGLFDLGYAKPDFWQRPEAHLPNSALRHSGDCLTEDFCVMEGHYFIRCVLELPLIGAPERYFGFGVWSTLSKKNFDQYVETFDSDQSSEMGPWFGWFSNRLKPYPDTLNLKCQVHPKDGRQRPWIEIESTDHPLGQEYGSIACCRAVCRIDTSHQSL
jgi:hypothetical protein